MTGCASYQKPIENLIGGEIRPEELEDLLRHTESCEACGRLFELHHDLDDPRFELTQADEVGLAAVRRSVLREVRPTAVRPVSRSRLPLAAALAAVLVAGGFLAGRAVDRTAEPGLALMPRIEEAAIRASRLEDGSDSPFSYSGVQVRDAGEGQVALSFQVSTHVDVVRPKDDPLVAEVLVQSMLQEESMGVRLLAVNRASGLLDSRVRDALILTMLRDESLPVRLRALSGLMEMSGDAAVSGAMLQVVAREESVQMRLQAIDYLTANRVEPRALEEAMDAGVPSQRYAVYERAQEYLNG